MADILKIFNRIPQMSNKVNVHFVEMSPFLAKTQAQTLGVTQPNEEAPTEEGTSVTRQTPAGVNVQWYRKFEDIDIKGFPMIVAHEFLDALPVHQFVYTRDGWRERMIGLDDKDKFQWVLAPSATASSRSLGPSGKYKEGDVYEVSPDSLHTAHQIAQAVKDDGMALIVDYGNKEPKRTPTVRGYKAHVMIEDIVEHEPGEIDLTADVSFQAVAKVCSDTCATYGPMSQGDWLRQMGIHTRTKQMVQSSQTREEQVKIIRSTKRLIDNEGMGSLFQFLSLVPISVDPPFPFVKANSCTAPL
ncbi:hypothetical protein, variant [Sphaeroforma arctica JP610]|nr:hypothetical protein, variant [Sphaeroforma arctica JP610]KNC81066.1 hypothetical protein, variant [Sphaeroforma arctica JP610]|eukprot:XP_014154968.1 hypothetical protein, variant [Sphaeroforma arctica JP610]